MAEWVSGTTQILAVYGDPIAHSLSPLMHNAAFQALGWDCLYIPCRVSPDQLAGAVTAIRALGFRGVNVTIPHKQQVGRWLDEISPESRQTGSINTIINHGDRLTGTSTDGIGFLRSLQEEGGFNPAGKRIAIIGAGGSAAAVLYSLIKAEVADIHIFNRNSERAHELVKRIQPDSKVEIQISDLKGIDQNPWDTVDLVVHTTSVGLKDDDSLIASKHLHPGMFVYDLVYKPGGTRLIQEAVKAGCSYLDGLSLLLYQGAESFRLWFDQEPPLAIMRKTLEKSLKTPIIK